MEVAIHKIKHAVHIPVNSYCKSVAEAVLKTVRQNPDCVLSLAFINDTEMAVLNQQWLQREGPTDVLSFNGEGNELGEVIINLDMVQRKLHEQGEKTKTVITRYIVHGVLSLLGMDHKEGPRAQEIQELEDTIVQKFIT